MYRSPGSAKPFLPRRCRWRAWFICFICVLCQVGNAELMKSLESNQKYLGIGNVLKIWYLMVRSLSPPPESRGDPSYQSTTFLLTITCLRAPQIMRFLFSQNGTGFSNEGHFHYFENSENDKISFGLDKQKCWNPVFSTPGRENLSESWISEGFWRLLPAEVWRIWRSDDSQGR